MLYEYFCDLIVFACQLLSSTLKAALSFVSRELISLFTHMFIH